jgi:hypothetical protein
MQAIQEQATPRASRKPLTFTSGKRECGINILQMPDERFSECGISISVTEAKPGQRRSAALDVSLS